MPIVEVLEEEMSALAADRGDKYRTATGANDAEELSCSQSAVEAALAVMKRGGSGSQATQAAEQAFTDAETRLAHAQLPVELDEFGRDVNLESRRDIQSR